MMSEHQKLGLVRPGWDEMMRSKDRMLRCAMRRIFGRSIWTLVLALMTACGGGGSGGASPMWVQIDTPYSSDDIAVDTPSVGLSGRAYCPDCPPSKTAYGYCPEIQPTRTSTVNVTWSN